MSPIDGVDNGLLERFRAAGARIAWRDAPKGRAGTPAPKGAVARIAHLHDEEALVVEGADGRRTVASGPVGALVVLLEIDRRGPAVDLRALAAGIRPGFDDGAIEATWRPRKGAAPGSPVPPADLVELARYALA